MRRDPAGVLECPGGRRYTGWVLVGPWQYQCTAGRPGWVPGIPPSQYYPPTNPGYSPTGSAVPAHRHGTPHVDGMHETVVSGTPKEILGVDNARVRTGYRSVTARALTHGSRGLPEPACGTRAGAVTGLA